MHYLDESHIFLFLIQLLILLGLARGFGTLLRRIGQPAISAEILVGVLLGPTVFGRVAPGAWRAVFPPDPIQQNMIETGTSLTFICLLGLLGGSITLKIGIHALFGFFVAGIMAGASRSLSQHTRQVITEMVRALLVPLFFVSVGLKLDFVARFNLFLVVFILFLGVAGRFIGAWVGATVAGDLGTKRHFIAAAHTPGGEMQIVIGILALEYSVISGELFVAITLGAVLSSIALGPWLKLAYGRNSSD
jgi:Kef-type K+ transport system membrane component KefB